MPLSQEETTAKLLRYAARKYQKKEFLWGSNYDLWPHTSNPAYMNRYLQSEAGRVAMLTLATSKMLRIRTGPYVDPKFPSHINTSDWCRITWLGRLVLMLPAKGRIAVFKALKYSKIIASFLGSLAFVTLLSNAAKGAQVVYTLGHNLAAFVMAIIVFFILMRALGGWIK